jgi:RNA polymerase sigma factor (sigma-70 family)
MDPANQEMTRAIGLTKETGGGGAAARKQAALEMIAREGPSLKKTARRYSICAEDAEDAYQRALEIALTKAPTDQPRELIRWTQVVTKHEALAIRRKRERLLGNPKRQLDDGEEREDWVAMIPSTDSGPDEAVERRERIARSREALRTLKPAELRALTLLAEGYSYAEIGEITGFSRTKINRCLAEGRERFRRLVSRSEDGSHCTDMAPLLSAFCDGETSDEDATAVREHLRACARCRATMRAYRATPGAAAALAPALPGSHPLLERAQELAAWLHSRVPGAGGATDSAVGQVATAGGASGAGMTTLAKLLAVCAGTAGGAAACVATGVAPVPFDPPTQTKAPTIERVSRAVIESQSPTAVVEVASPPARDPEPKPEPTPRAEVEEVQPAPTPAPIESGAVEPSEPSPPPPPPVSEAPSSSSGSAAGEFGP